MKTTSLSLDPERLDYLAGMLKAVAHSSRICIIELLEEQNELTVTDIGQCLDLEQPVVSHHLIKMRDKGILKVRKEGRKVFYSLADQSITNILKCLQGCQSN